VVPFRRWAGVMLAIFWIPAAFFGVFGLEVAPILFAPPPGAASSLSASSLLLPLMRDIGVGAGIMFFALGPIIIGFKLLDRGMEKAIKKGLGVSDDE
jgi:hypothetical protein